MKKVLPRTAFTFPWPIPILLAFGFWTCIVLGRDTRLPRCSFARVFKACSSLHQYDDVGVEENCSYEKDADSAVFQPEFFQGLADLLREWRAPLTTAFDPEKVNEAMEFYVPWLERCAKVSAPESLAQGSVESIKGRGGHYFAAQGRRGQYNGEFFCKVLLFAFELRGASKDGTMNSRRYMKRVLTKAIRCFPVALASLAERMLEGAEVPSPAILSRASLYLDVAYMREMAEKHMTMINNQDIFFGLADKSDICGREYMMTEYFRIDGEMLAEAADCALKLKGYPHDPAEVTDDMLAEMSDLMDVIRSAKHHHVFPPSCLGSRMQGHVHSSASVVHQFRLESEDWNATSKLADRFFSFTTDTGESALKKTHFKVGDTFAHWLNQAPMITSENDLHDLDADALLKNLESEGNITISLRHVLDVSGLFHMNENIQKRLLTQLPSWSLAKKPLEAMLCVFHARQSRRRFVRRCLPGPNHADNRKLFEFGPPTLDGGRVWGVLHKGTLWLLERRELISTYWDGDHLGQED